MKEDNCLKEPQEIILIAAMNLYTRATYDYTSSDDKKRGLAADGSRDLTIPKNELRDLQCKYLVGF